MSKHRVRLAFVAAVVLLLGSLALRSASGHQTSGRHHKTQNGAGCPVSHGHFPLCINGQFCANGAACPTNALCEATLQANPAHRMVSWTSTYNCHGRTFDDRDSWTGSASIFLGCDNGIIPTIPQPGDAIVWSGGSIHSVTIKGGWSGLSTPIRSKYGCCGEYHHSLSHSTNVYGGNWGVVRLFSSPIFLTGGGDELDGVPLPADPAELETIVKSMPWYPAVLASAIEYAVEHPRRVWENGRVSDRTRTEMQSAEDPAARLEILAEDLRDPGHYTVLAVYDHPADSTDYLEGIEAGRVLAAIARDYPDELRDPVVRLLEETALGTHYDVGARAASIVFASRVLEGAERTELMQRVTGTLSLDELTRADGQIDLVDYYSQRYLQPEAE